MLEQSGTFIVLEGSDGSGKSTQFRLLRERLRAVGYDVEVFKFPQYDQDSSHFIKNYLNGAYGPAADVSPYTASLFYALDRYEAAPKIRNALNQGKIVLADRFVGSNMAHQGSKLSSAAEQRGFFIWDDGLEFQLLNIPRPTINIFLRVPAKISRLLMHSEQRRDRSYTQATHDEHEKDLEHLNKTVETYDTLCKLFPKDFQAVECVKDNKLLSIAEVNDKIWDKIKPMLPPKPAHAGRDVVVKLKEVPEHDVKQHQSNDRLPQNAIPNSTPSEDVQNTVLKVSIKKVSLLALGYVHAPGLIVEETAVEWPDNERYSYYTQAQMPKKTAQVYKESMARMINLHKQMRATVRDSKDSVLLEALAASVPAAALASATISGPADEVYRLATKLQSNALAEVRWLAQQLLAAYQKQGNNNPKPPEAGEFASRKEQLNDVITKLISEHLPQNLPRHTESVSLLEARPRNEFDLLVDSIYPYSTSSRSEITEELEHWSYQQKREALIAAARQDSSLLLSQAHYLWNIICDRPTFEQLMAMITVSDLQMQPSSPRYGYEVPEVIEQAGIDELYIECFDESLKLFSNLQAAGCNDIAPYATLLGHKNRWQFSTSAEDLKINQIQPSRRYAKKLLNQMHEKVAEKHPLIADFIASGKSKKEQSASPSQKLETPDKSSSRRNRRARRPKK